MQLTAIIPAHHPHRVRLARTLAALAAQTLPAENWETLLVDNASTPALDLAFAGLQSTVAVGVQLRMILSV